MQNINFLHGDLKLVLETVGDHKNDFTRGGFHYRSRKMKCNIWHVFAREKQTFLGMFISC